MILIYETTHFNIETKEESPHISRTDGGHLIISPKTPREKIQDLTSEEAKEFIKLVMLTGEAMMNGMKKQGIELGKINYQANGNFNLEFHMHLYGRAYNATTHKYGNCIRHGPTQEEARKEFEPQEPLHPEDIAAIKEEIERLLQADKFKNF